MRELARRSEAAAREALKKRFFDRTEREIESIDNFVAPLKFFAELRPECRRELCETLGHATVAPGEVFVRQKGAGNTAYVVLDGTCNKGTFVCGILIMWLERSMIECSPNRKP